MGVSGVIALSDEKRQGSLNSADAGPGEANSTEAGRPDTARAGRVGKRRADRDARKIEPQIGRALRSVYDETVGEAIPPEMLELLGKLD